MNKEPHIRIGLDNKMERDICLFIRVKHLSNADVLVITHFMFSIALLGVNAPYMGHHFQVQVLCHLQGRSLDGFGSRRLF